MLICDAGAEHVAGKQGLRREDGLERRARLGCAPRLFKGRDEGDAEIRRIRCVSHRASQIPDGLSCLSDCAQRVASNVERLGVIE